MSGGLSDLSDADLMQRLQASGYNGTGAAPASAPAPASSPLSALSDEELLHHLAASRAGGTASGGKVRSVPNPLDAAGTPPSFTSRFAEGPTSDHLDTSTPLGEGLRAKADEMLVGKPSTTNQIAAAVIRGTNAIDLNLPRAAGAAYASLPYFGNGQSYHQNLELAGEQEEALARQYPKTALAGTVAGIGGAIATNPAADIAVLGRVGSGALTGLGYGAAGEYIGTLDPWKAAQAGVIGGGLGAGAVHATDFAVKGGKALYGMISRGVPVTNAEGALTTTAKAMLRREGVAPETLTPDVQAGIARAVSVKGESEAAIREALAGEFGIPLSRGQATGDAQALALEQAATRGDRGSRAQTIGQTFAQRQNDAIEAGAGRFADRARRGMSIDNPTQASEVVADQAREYARRSGFEADAAQQNADDVLALLRGPNAGDTLDAGASVAGGLRDEAARGKAAYQAAYGDLAQVPGEFVPGALDQAGARVRARLGTDTPIDPVLHPAANRALADLNNLPELLGMQDGRGPTLQQVEQVRKRLGAYYTSTAQNPADRRALGAIRQEFDNHVNDALHAGAFEPPGSLRTGADDFPGTLTAPEGVGGRPGAPEAMQSLSGGLPPIPTGRARGPESLVQYLGRNGGIRLDGDARANDLGRMQTGFGPLGRKNGLPIEAHRDKLVSEGFIRPDDGTGFVGRNIDDEIYHAIDLHRQGQPTYRPSDLSRGSAPADVGGRLADDSAAYAERLAPFRQQVADDLASTGLRPHEIEPSLLHDASERLMRREVDDPAAAYEMAVMGHDARHGAGSASDAVPFPAEVQASTLRVTEPTISASDAIEKMRLARSLFQDYRQKFAPSGAGDDVGLAMRKIVDRNAEPVEVARMLYAGSPGLNIRVADRIKRVVGETSDIWAAHQQGYLASILNGRDMSPRAVSDRINTALADRRGLTYRVLDDQHITGLRQFQAATRAASARREAVPEWISNLGRTDFDPNRITGDLFGSGVPGSRPGSAAYAGSLKRFVGEDSAEWSGLRLAAWQRLVMKSDGSGMLPPQQVASRIREFSDGTGSGLAKQMFEPELLAEMRRYGKAVQSTVRNGVPLPNGGGAGGKIAGKALDAITTALGFHLGGFGGAGAAYTGRFGTKVLQNSVGARAARQSFEGGAPSFRAVGPTLDLKHVGVGAGGLAAYGVD